MSPSAYFLKLADKLAYDLNILQVEKLIEVLLAARERGAQIFAIGNGGSAATAAHFANDLAVGTRAEGPSFRSQALTDCAALTCIGNDFGFDRIFELQLKARLKPDDLVIAFSASGNSPNIIKAIEYANGQSCITVGITGFDGGRLLELADHAVHVTTEKGEYGIVEDIHLAINHAVVSTIRARIASSQK